jgi:hypothetical protein
MNYRLAKTQLKLTRDILQGKRMKTLTKEQQCDLLIQCGIAKLFNENSTYLLGELTGEQKHWFKTSVNANNNLISTIEKRMNTENIETYTLLYEALNDGITNLRKQLLTHL